MQAEMSERVIQILTSRSVDETKEIVEYYRHLRLETDLFARFPLTIKPINVFSIRSRKLYTLSVWLGT